MTIHGGMVAIWVTINLMGGQQTVGGTTTNTWVIPASDLQMDMEVVKHQGAAETGTNGTVLWAHPSALTGTWRMIYSWSHHTSQVNHRGLLIIDMTQSPGEGMGTTLVGQGILSLRQRMSLGVEHQRTRGRVHLEETGAKTQARDTLRNRGKKMV